MLSVALGLWVAAAPQVRVTSCAASLESAELERLVRLEWAQPPENARVEVRCGAGTWRLHVEVPGHLLDETLALPPLEGASLARVLAVVVAERGRALGRGAVDAGVAPMEPVRVRARAPVATPPEPVADAGVEAPLPPPPIIVAVVEPIAAPPMVSVVEPEPPPARSSAPFRRALLRLPLDGAEPAATFRLAAGGGLSQGLWLGPTRGGPELRFHAGPLALGASASFGATPTAFGDVRARTFTVEPSLTVACVDGWRWQLCTVASGLFGYGAIDGPTATPGQPTDPNGAANAAPARVENAVLGGTGGLSASIRVLSWLALDVDLRAGGAWAVFATLNQKPVASLGGGVLSASVALSATWGGR